MFKPTLKQPALTVAIATLLTMPIVAMAFDGSQYSDQAKVTIQQARKDALSTLGGKIVSEELEKEKGGSGLRYSFDIRHQGKIHEVGVDAKTGKILENSVEGADSD